MARNKNAHTHKAQKRRRQLERIKLHIRPYHELHTLKRSARKQLERERAPQLCILPWQDLRHSSGRMYPRAGLLGLPTELRQHILHFSYTMEEDLDHDINATILSTKKKNKLEWANTTGSAPARKMDEGMRFKFGLSSHEANLVTVLSYRIGALSLTSPATYCEVKYVCAQWEDDLDK
jgi:hypothetical protein